MAHNTGNARGRADSMPTYKDASLSSEENLATTTIEESVCQEMTEVHQDSQGYGVHPSMDQQHHIAPPSAGRPRNPTSANAHSVRRGDHGRGRYCVVEGPVLEPPVTKATLSELDVNRIVHNTKLRHDINFDAELCFRPNTDGERGHRKMQKVRQFWGVMEQQLKAYLSGRHGFAYELSGNHWCLPITLQVIRSILETAVPQEDRRSVQESFNVDLLMQQFRQGAADIARLALWLSKLLKRHCAPMRDAWVDTMVELLTRGERDLDSGALTEGMKTLLEVLEAMRLDLANHQIRCLRPLMIENTINFEQEFFIKKIKYGKLDVLAAHTWFRRATRSLDGSTRPEGPLWSLMRAVIDLMLPHSRDDLPCTFAFDEDRLIRLRSDLQDLINLRVCVLLHQSLDRQSRREQACLSSQEQPQAKGRTDLTATPILVEQDIALRLSGRPGSDTGILDSTGEEFELPLTAGLHSAPSTMSSLSGWPLGTRPRASDQNLDCTSHIRSSLQAILASSSGPDRWTTLVPSLALQIVRSTPAPLTILPQIERRLAMHLSERESRVYHEAEKHILSQLLPVLRSRLEKFSPLTSYQIFDIATAHKAYCSDTTTVTNAASPAHKEAIATLATRIAHIGVLHWRVWAPLAYLVDPRMQSS